jgi:hypothetical protein
MAKQMAFNGKLQDKDGTITTEYHPGNGIVKFLTAVKSGRSFFTLL